MQLIHVVVCRRRIFLLLSLFPVILSSCSLQKKLSRLTNEIILKDSLFRNAHLGISIFDAGNQQFYFNHNADKYFIPASNVKIATCYAAMKFLPGNLNGIRYFENDTAIFLLPTGDPSFLHPDFKQQPVMAFLQSSTKRLYITEQAWKTESLGYGWSWDDYNDYYMPERSPLPVYGNIIRWIQVINKKENPQFPADTLDSFVYSEPEVDWEVDLKSRNATGTLTVRRERDKNIFTISEGSSPHSEVEVPFVTYGIQSALKLLSDTLHKQIRYLPEMHGIQLPSTNNSVSQFQTIQSQPTDSLLKPMMYRSDNFFAEQTLLMASEKLLGVMNEERLIDSLLKSELNALPQKPRWVDGSGLSRYNLFTPRDFVWLLDKMKKEFGWERLTKILPTGGTGTLRNYYKADSGFIYGKTGSMSGVVAYSGFMITQKNRTLIFSILVNNNLTSATSIRRQVEAYLQAIRNRY